MNHRAISDRERAIARHALRGLTLGEIALRLGLSPDVVAGHWAKLRRRMGRLPEVLQFTDTNR